MVTAAPGIRDAIDGATAAELRGVLLALEGRVVDVGKHVSTSFYSYATDCETLRRVVHGVQRVPMITLRQGAERLLGVLFPRVILPARATC